jgi:hypothetical protein
LALRNGCIGWTAVLNAEFISGRLPDKVWKNSWSSEK